MSGSRIPLLTVDAANAELTRVLTDVRTATGRVLNLHRVLGHAPALMEPFAQLALALRNRGTTSRRLRELVILRVAQLTDSAYELAQHLPMARACGIGEAQIAQLPLWRQHADLFSADEQAALAYTEALQANQVADATFEALRRHFDEAQIIELTLTAGFYVMVALTARALALPVETP